MSSSLKAFPISGSHKKESNLSWTKSHSTAKSKRVTLSAGVKGELAVHKKKVAEVRSWLLDNLSCKQGSSAVLLLTGPAGSGKTATMEVLASELGLELQEWINPVSGMTEGEFNEYSSWRNFSQSQLRKFEDFILRANKYPTLSIFGEKSSQSADKKILLIEDLPNIFFREATKLHEVLSTYKQTSRSPVVFIVSDSHHGDSNVHKLLPKDIQYKLGIQNISFNPVAHTSLVKTINRITSLESQQNKSTFLPPSKETIDLLAQNSGGDIRTAINGLHFFCVQDRSTSFSRMFDLESKGELKQKRCRLTKPSKKGKPSKSESIDTAHSRGTSPWLLYGQTDNQPEPDTVTAIGDRDVALFLFRALGKILYCKRDSTLSDTNLLPSHLSHNARNHLTFSPEEVLGRIHLSSDMFNLYLHQNYLEFFSDVDAVVKASEHFSNADYITKEWMHQSSMSEYSSCLVARGLMFNSSRSGGSTAMGRGWRPLHKPQWFDVSKKMRDGCNTARDLFRGYQWPSIVQQTEIIPYLAITDVPLQTQGQISFLQGMSSFRKSRFPCRSVSDTLDEKECGMESDDDGGGLQDSQAKGAIAQRTTKEGAEEYDSKVTQCVPDDDLIEDFDDED
ncbi:cell cycle checkpoint protein RAD17-like isoform X2 [Montipora capricornis]|uniref:cell cycle checkpoint protein RAD17-like isoform X2 n=1 Tax=Montipora capricornis TaxID=246305 RepID=UPI0035F11A60